MSTPLSVAVVGAGPAGFYTCEDLLKREGFEVDLYDALPTPFGLVRVVVGNGNVALDVARMLLLGGDELAATDTADHAVAALAIARVEHVIVLGRRGPGQAAFTSPELLELGDLSASDVVVDPAEVALD